MQGSLRKIAIGFVFLIATCVVAVVGYWLAGWDLLDAVYMVVITIYGVGYGEVEPIETPGLKLFTMVVIVAGCSAAIYVVGGFVQMIAEGEINRALGVRRMTKGIEKLQDHAIVCGFGRVGRILADELRRVGTELVIVDSSADRLREAEQDGMLVVLGSATQEDTLEKAGLLRARVLAAVLPDDAANILVTLTARELSDSVRIIARGEYPATERKLLRSGADKVVLPAAIGASKIAHLMTSPSAEQWLSDELGRSHLNDELRQIGLTLHEISVNPGSVLVGRYVTELESSCPGGFVVVAVRQSDGTLIDDSNSWPQLLAGDTLLVLGHKEEVLQLARRGVAGRTHYRGSTG